MGISMRQLIRRSGPEVLADIPRVLFLLLLAAAPWAYGAAHPRTEELVACAMLGIFAAECLVLLVSSRRRKETRAPAPPWILAGLIIGYGVFLSCNARWIFLSESSRFIPIEPLLAASPGWIDLDICTRKVGITAGALVALYFGLTLGADPRWRRIVWYVIVTSGVAVGMFGILQVVTQAPAIFWAAGKRSSHFFGPFVYHGNAGAFLNLILPLVFTRALFVLRKRDGAVEKYMWCSLALTLFTCCMITGSKGAMLIGSLLCLGALLWWIHRRLKRGDLATRALIINGCLGLFGICALGMAFGWERTFDRWSHFLEGTGEFAKDRRLVYETCIRIIKDQWIAGFGAGTFRHVFPHFTHHLGDQIEGVWLYAHQDYLQTIIEWGWLGASLWAGLLLGGLIEGIRTLWRQMNKGTSIHAYETLGLLLALAGILIHALFDYPLQVLSLLIFALTICGLLWSAFLSERRHAAPFGK